jgi:N-carbamoylputrescine amidase
LWALETWATYAEADVQVILSPRATGAETRARWLAAGVVAAVRSGAYSISSNRVEPSGSCGGAGWVISPEGRVVATTTPEAPFATVGVDLAAADSARAGYPRYVFRAEAPR